MVTINDLRARDIMQTKVVTFTPSTPIQSAIEGLEQLHIGGAPVVDGNSHIVGMLSAFDIAKSEHMGNEVIQSENYEFSLNIGSEDEPREMEDVIFSRDAFSPRTLGRTIVADWMSTEIVSVDPDRDLRAICGLMVKEHIHRVPVVENGKLIGIISTLDILRCIAGDPPLRETGFTTRCSEESVRESETQVRRSGSSAPKSPMPPRGPRPGKSDRGGVRRL